MIPPQHSVPTNAPVPIVIIAAVARNGVIGNGSLIPWHLPEDLKRFRRLTMGHAVIMGRKTFESIGKPLTGRNNIVITRSREWNRAGSQSVPSIEAAFAAIEPPRPAFVIGGAEIYALALPVAERLHLTEIESDFRGETFFPRFERSRWREVSRERHMIEGRDGFSYSFAEYERNP